MAILKGTIQRQLQSQCCKTASPIQFQHISPPRKAIPSRQLLHLRPAAGTHQSAFCLCGFTYSRHFL